jgi:hypothetical protein
VGIEFDLDPPQMEISPANFFFWPLCSDR